MTKDEIALVQESWALVAPQAAAAMQLFYHQLFAADERFTELFSGTDMDAQGLHLADAPGLVVCQLEQPESLNSPLQELGARHVNYGVCETDFDAVGTALLATLQEGLGVHWTNRHLIAWTAAWRALSAPVLDGFRAQSAA